MIHHDDLQQAHPEIKITPFIDKFDENEKRCRTCGYKLTNEEIKKYEAFCVFCPHIVWKEKYRFPFTLGKKIHNEKVNLRLLFMTSNEAFYLEHAIRSLEEEYWEEIRPRVYSEEKNFFQRNHEELNEKLNALKAECKRVYYAALGEMGERYTRELSKEKKKRLLAVLSIYNRNQKEKQNERLNNKGTADL